MKSLTEAAYDEPAILSLEQERKILKEKVTLYEDTLGKIADPRKRDHREPDHYTQLGCLMHMAEEAIEKGKQIEEQHRGQIK